MPRPADDYVRIFDTTLRDGEQSPGATMTSAEKLEVAKALARLGVDVIEAGFPAASPDDHEAVKRIALELTGGKEQTPSGEPPIIAGLARASRKDIDACWSAVKHARRPRIHTFLATSDIHLEHKLKMTRAEVLEKVSTMVAHARSLCEDVEFSPEDAGRSDPVFLYEVLEAAIRAGATTLNIPDTVGYTTPEEFGALIKGIIDSVKGAKAVTISVHCHNDLGLATANSLAGVRAGARQVEVAVNGIGERAGNTALEEVVMALHTRRAHFGLRTGIDTTQIMRASRLVHACTGMLVQPNKAVVGANAFAHEAGIHQDGMLKHRDTYEIMKPEDVGAAQTTLVLGKHSGRHAVRRRLEELGFVLADAEFEKTFERFKQIAERKKEVTDADLEAMAGDGLSSVEEVWKLDGLQVACGTMGLPTATVRLAGPGGALHVRAEVGSGPVDAAYKAIDAIVHVPVELLEFAVSGVTEGIDALGSVTVRIRGEVPASTMNAQKESVQQRSFGGFGADTDIIVASAKAYLAAINKLIGATGGRPSSAPALMRAANEA